MTATGAAVPVKSADRVMAVLELLGAEPSLAFAEIVERLQLPKSSAHALLQTIEQRRYIVFDEQQRTYRLGTRIWELANANHGIERLRSLVSPLMVEVVGLTGETVQLAILDGLDAVYLALVESPHPMKLSSRPGVRLPAHVSAIGKALLAGLEPGEARRRLQGVTLERETERTITDPAVLLRELEKIRTRGYSSDVEEFAIGLRCVAVPVHDATGAAVAAMSVSMPTPRYSRPAADRARGALLDASAEASARLGHWSR